MTPNIPRTGEATLFAVPLIRFFVALILFVALLNGQRDLALWGLLVLGVVSAAKLWSRMSLSGIGCRISVDKERLFPGETLQLQVTAENAKFLPVWLQIALPLGAPLRPFPGETALTRDSGLLWRQRVRFEWRLEAGRRGVHRIGPLRMDVADLLGLFPREKKSQASQEVVVFPRLVPLKPLDLPRREFFGVPGSRSPVLDPVYILGTRDYQEGTPARNIHWKASARHSRLQEKLFEPTEQEKLLLLVEAEGFARNRAEEEFEETLEVAASMAVRADRIGYAVGLVTNCAVVGGVSPVLRVARNPRQLPALLDLLARLRMEPLSTLAHTLRLGLGLSWGVTCVLFSREISDATLGTALHLEGRRIPVIPVVSGPRPEPEPTLGKLRNRVYTLGEIRVKEDKKE